MLASLLPGVRELRAPLAAGYVWLVVGWLALAEQIPRPGDNANGIYANIYEIAGHVGPATVAVAAGFAAYLVGVLSTQLTEFGMPRLKALRRKRWINQRTAPTAAIPSAAGEALLTEAVLDQLSQRVDKESALREQLDKTRISLRVSGDLTNQSARRDIIDVRVEVDSYVSDLRRDLPLMPLRLLSEPQMREIYGDFDRNRAEAEFRAAVSLPIAALVIVLGVRSSPIWLFGLVVPALLVYEAMLSASTAADVLAEFVRARPEQAPSLIAARDGDLLMREDWKEYAADKGFAEAITWRAQSVLSVQGREKAEPLFRKAAEKGKPVGSPSAMMWLAGYLHRQGRQQEAEYWYDKAASANEPDAVMVRKLSSSLSFREFSDLKAAYADDAPAMIRTGRRLEEGNDLNGARKWYERAIGHDPSADVLLERVLRKLGLDPAAKEVERKAARRSTSLYSESDHLRD